LHKEKLILEILHAAFMEETLKAAGEVLLRYFRKHTSEAKKSDASIVTNADLEAEQIILDSIAKHFPQAIKLTEENHQKWVQAAPGSEVWIVDPLDGTTNYANGYEVFCTTMAYGIVDQKGRVMVQAGSIWNPISKNFYISGKGCGAFKDGKSISVRKEREFADAFLVTGFAYTKGIELSVDVDVFEDLAQGCAAVRRDGSAALDLAWVAEGIFDAYWERGLKPWDMAAGALLVAEAGGICRNYSTSVGSSFDLFDGNVIAGYPSIVSKIAERLGRQL
jgi:myo-inositol-1(or 4)-monophosphatase